MSIYNTLSTSNSQIIFKPTWLCVKQHSVTGLKYFCKTVKKNPLKYNGSGKFWKNHITKYGKDKVITLWCHLYTDKQTIIDEAIAFSKYHDIVNSNDWANLIPENGWWGGGAVIGSKRSKETCERIGQTSRGRLWSEESKQNFKKPKTAQHNHTMSLIRKGKTWWNNGVTSTMSRGSPGSEWHSGRIYKRVTPS
jgi:hypothetical protein